MTTYKTSEIERAKARKYYAKNRDRCRAYARKWHWKNREQSLQKCKEYHLKNADAIKERRSAYNKANREARNETRKRWRAKNPERVRLHQRRWAPKVQQWRKENPVRTRLQTHRRRERVKATMDKAAINVLSQLISSANRLKCAICGKNMPKSDRTIDHVIPLSKGGTGDIWNLSIVHHTCNIRKNAKMPDELNFAGDSAQLNKNKTSGNTEFVVTCEPNP